LKPDKKLSHLEFSQLMNSKYGVLMNPSFEGDNIRIVTHRDVERKDLEYVVKCFKEAL
jgi:threonine aldolase